MKSKPKVLLLFGGESSEHEVSIASARNVYAAIETERFEAIPCYIDKQGRWWLVHEVVDSMPSDAKELVPLLGSQSFSFAPGDHTIAPDIIFPVLHGKNGEDGSVQALGQLLHIPVVGCDMTASAICMDKVATKEVLSANDLPNVPYMTYHISGEEIIYETVARELGEPLFVKPARAGSSVGVSKVSSSEQFAGALTLAHEHSEVVLIEKGIVGRELEVAVLGNPPHHEVSGVGEIVAGDEFYSYEAKYSPKSTSQTVIPAELDAKAAEQIRSIAHQAYAVLGCQGMARIDFFLDETGQVYLNEVNTIPGFTNISMYPKLWQHEGLSYSELITELLSIALDSVALALVSKEK